MDVETQQQQGALKVNIKRWIAALAFSTCLIGLTSISSAQSNVALVDIGQIFKSHPVFSQRLDALKQEAEQFKAGTADIQQALLRQAEALRQYQPGSAEYNAAESKLAQETAKREVEQKSVMTKLMIREAQLHYSTYVEVTKFIADYCQSEGIDMVLRFNSAEMNASDPNTIMQKVNGGIVFHRNDKNITNAIVARIAQSKGTAARSAGQKLK